MIRWMFALVLMFSLPVLAELKPVSNVETQICGWLNRSERLCSAKSASNSYIFLNHFLGANKAIGPVKEMEKKTTKGKVITLSGPAVDRDGTGNYQVEKVYTLTITEADETITGKLVSEYRNAANKKVTETYRAIPMERMVHTQGVTRGLAAEAIPAVSTVEVEK